MPLSSVLSSSHSNFKLTTLILPEASAECRPCWELHYKIILLSMCGSMVGSLQRAAASPSLIKTSSFVPYAWESVFQPRMQKVLLFAPSPSRRARADLVLLKAGKKGKLPGGWLQFSLLAAGCSVYWAGEGTTVVKLPADFWGGRWEAGGTVAKSAGDTKLCPASCWRRLLPPCTGHLRRPKCQREPRGKRSPLAASGDGRPRRLAASLPQRKAWLF